MIKKVNFICCLILSASGLYAQAYLADTSFVYDAKENVRNLFSNHLEDQIHLYNGSYYTEYESTGKEHPYLFELLEEGSVFYDGSLYRNEEILYNLQTDMVIVNDYYGENLIQLVPEKIKYFELKEHTYIRLKNQSLKEGFYELLADGDIKLYARRLKLFKQEVSQYKVENIFNEKNYYYVFRNGEYYQVKNKKAVRTVLSDYDKMISQYIKKNKLVFRRDFFESSIQKIIEYCNEL